MIRSAASLVNRALGVGISTAFLSALLLAASAHTTEAVGGVGSTCSGDCDGSGDVTVNEIVTLVNMALGSQTQLSACPNGIPPDITDVSQVDVALIIQAVNFALSGCPATPTPVAVTPTRTPTPTLTPTPVFTALTARMTVPRAGHTATLLSNGKVLLIGGDDLFPSTGTTNTTIELYDPVAKMFTPLTASPLTPREQNTATLLPNGQVLLTGGFNDHSSDLDTAEIYDPVAKTFTALPAAMTIARSGHTATLLPNGKVLLTGGSYHSHTALNTAELYDPTAQTFTAINPTMTSGRVVHTATLLSNSQVLLTGGFNGSGADLNTAEVYDPVANTFTALTATMTTARAGHTATLLPNGQVLLTGGGHGPESIDSFTVLNTAEVYNPTAKIFTALTATLTAPRAVHTATLLPNGQVLITGGANSTTSPALNTAELYDQ